MAYTSKPKLDQLDELSSLDDTDVMVAGDQSDADRAKKITWANLKTAITTLITGLSSYFNKTTETLDNITAGTTNVHFTATDESKLDAIEASADVTDAGNIGTSIHGASAKTTPVDADTMPAIDSAASNVLKKVTWANIKATLKTYFDTVYSATTHNHTGTYEPADATILKQADVDDTPVNGVTTAPVSSNWAYDHANASNPHSITANVVLPSQTGNTGKYLKTDGTNSSWDTPSAGDAWDGDITDINLDGGTDIGADLADADLIMVDDGAGGTNRKSALSRVWTYITSKLQAVTSLAGYGFLVDEDNMASNLDTKVPTQQSVKAYADTKLANIVEDTTPQLGGALDCNGNSLTDVHELRLDASPDTDHTANGLTTNTINAGATIAQSELVYLASTGKWALTDASAVATAEGLLAVSLGAGTADNPLLVALPGSIVRDDTWNWTVGGEIYISETAGAITQTAPTTTDAVVRVIGHAISADVIFFNPENTVVVHA